MGKISKKQGTTREHGLSLAAMQDYSLGFYETLL